MKVHWLFLIVASILCAGFALVACGDDDDDSNEYDDDEQNGTGDTWTDSSTGLMWQNGTGCCYDWDEATNYCQSLVRGGHSDWRLPSISELRSLLRGSDDTQTGGSCGVTDDCRSPSCWSASCSGCSGGDGPGNGCYWPSELNGQCSWYWSSSPVLAHNGNVWFVNFKYGNVGSSYGNYYNNIVRCVRQ